MNHLETLPALPERAVDSHKGNYGRVLVIGGSQGMAGAVALSGRAALRSGAGLVRIATAADCQPAVAQFDPCYTTASLPCDASGRIAETAWDALQEQLQWASAVAIGPGLSMSDELVSLVSRLHEQCERPLVVDADGLNCLSRSRTWQTQSQWPGPRLWTPHPGEFARLFHVPAPNQRDQRDQREQGEQDKQRASASEHAALANITLLLKGPNTLVTDGKRAWNNQTGNPGLATGGSGDVLTGLLAALLAQGWNAWDAARLGAHLHGLAGDLAAAKRGMDGIIATDLIEHLPEAIAEFRRAKQ